MDRALRDVSSTLAVMSAHADLKIAVLMVVLVLWAGLGCYPRISPTGPVVADAEAFVADAGNHQLDYSSLTRLTDLPVLPMRLWGVDFDEEMLFELKGHSSYAMVEICHVRKRSGEWTWFALVAEHDGRQHVAVGSEADHRLGQSFPAPVYRSGLQVERTEERDRIVYTFAFSLPDGETIEGRVHARARGAEPGPSQRNGSAMNHSRATALAIIDLEEFSWAKAEVKIAGVDAPVRSLAPGLPYAMRLEQVAGGIAAGQMTITETPDAATYELRLGTDAGREPLRLTRRLEGEDLVMTSANEVVDSEYRFRMRSGAEGPMELYLATVHHGDVEAFKVRFVPPLPDLRYSLQGDLSGRMIAGVHGRQGYMVGEYHLSTEGGSHLDLLPSAPFWACERPMRSTIERGAQAVTASTRVVPGLALGGLGAEACFSRR